MARPLPWLGRAVLANDPAQRRQQALLTSRIEPMPEFF
jgi:hypothetical protein